MKSIMMKETIFAVVAGLLLSACGGGGGSSSSSGTTPPAGTTPTSGGATPPSGGTTPPSGTTPPTVIQIPQCGSTADLGKANSIDVTGKTIKKEADGTEVRIWHKPDGSKSACMITGNATIL